ncbi:MAG: tetratricopeptide repeat protein [Bryobacteraceae bacterium]|nr:tetratricopeptide repeat protein [Bryobacteraceae bacterium]
MPAALLLLLLLADSFDIRGTLVPATAASVALHGSTSPFHASTLAGADGRFRFRNIPQGTYTLIVFIPGQGETRKTISVGPSTADPKGRIEIAVRLDESRMTPDRSRVVPLRELAIPRKARDEYRNASRRLQARDIPGAIACLERAVQLAPQFAAAWNFLGTIAYQTRRYADAEKYFLRALEADPNAYEPVVNLGGVYVTLGRFDEAWKYNLNAVLRRPNDALAQSQMGMTYFGLGRYDLAEKYLLEAIRLDPAHFSHPQLTLAEICLRRGQPARAAGLLEDFLRRHPDNPARDSIRAVISRLRGSPGS